MRTPFSSILTIMLAMTLIGLGSVRVLSPQQPGRASAAEAMGAPVTVAQLRGSGSRTLPPFELHGGEQEIHYHVHGSEPLHLLLEILPLDVSSPGSPARIALVEQSGSGRMLLAEPAGAYRLVVDAVNCSWEIEVRERR